MLTAIKWILLTVMTAGIYPIWRIWRWIARPFRRKRRRGRRRRKRGRRHARIEFSAEERAAIRAELYRRDGYNCGICGEPLSSRDEPIHIDHIKPVSFGGSNSLRNLRLTHKSCNMERGNRLD